ncbi:MAG: hypothetical protein PW791_01870 [Neorhizobium sp.]|nr:hypothetical protein [Neorhizobium sp.]
MPFSAYIAHFIAAAMMTNGIPHFVSGVCGRPFRTPFVRLTNSGAGEPVSPPVVNVVWGWANFLVAFLIFANIGPLYIGTPGDTIFVAAGMLIMGIILATIFGRRPA